MKKIIILSSALVTVSSAGLQTTVATKQNVLLPQVKNQTQSQFNDLQTVFNSKTFVEKAKLKQNLVSAISLENGTVVLHNNKLNPELWDPKVYEIITSKEYLATLNYFHQYKLDLFNDENEVKNHNSNIQQQNALFSNDIWVETYWYWFGYFRVHFSSRDIDALTEAGGSITDLGQQIAAASPYAGLITLPIALVITSYVVVLKSYNYGNGAWIGFHLLGPVIPIDFGSN